MSKIAIFKENSAPFEGDKYEIDTNRAFGGYKKGDLICHCNPFLDVPLKLELAINPNGDLSFRKWEWTDKPNNQYLHTFETPQKFTPTAEQCDTVSGLWSGRIKFEGLTIAVGGTVQDICPVNHEREEQLLNQKIFLNASFSAEDNKISSGETIADNIDKVNRIANKIEQAIANDQISKEENHQLNGSER